MKTYRHDEAPLQIFGVPFFEETGKLVRLPDELLGLSVYLPILGKRVPGARLGFRTNAKEIHLRIEFADSLVLDHGMSVYQSQSCLVFVGDRPNSRYVGLAYPKTYDDMWAEGTFHKSDDMEEILIWLPRNAPVKLVTIEVDDDAEVLPPTPYRYSKPIVYYGTSITESGCAMVSNGYTSLISRWLDVDFYNLGLSGSAVAELEMADYINTIEKSILVYDYDQNAPSAEFLKRTHEPFFKRIREKDPQLPVVMMTCPFAASEKERTERREVVRQTYENALAAGDKNVYFLDGANFYGEQDKEICTVDTIHPNDLGFYRMATAICPVISDILKKQEESNVPV